MSNNLILDQKKERVEYLGDGAYVKFDGHGFSLMANDHLNPTDTVYLDIETIENFFRFIEICCGVKISAVSTKEKV